MNITEKKKIARFIYGCNSELDPNATSCVDGRPHSPVMSEVAWSPVQLLHAGLQRVLQLRVLLAAALQLLQQSAVFLPQGLALPAALLQLGRPPGQSLPQLLVLLLLVCARWRTSARVS